MARLIYALLAFALGTLVAGFLVRDSSVPLFASIGLSALVLVLILFGTSRRLRRQEALETAQADLADVEIVEIDEGASQRRETEVVAFTPKRRPPGRRRVDIEGTAAIDEHGGEATEVVVPPERRPPRRRAARVRSEPSEGERPEFERAEGVEVAVDGGTSSTIEMPETPSRPVARTRRPRRATKAETTAAGRRGAPTTAARPARTVPTASPKSPKVWVIPGRSRYHTRDCRFAKGDQLREVTEATARRRGYVPCSVCEP